MLIFLFILNIFSAHSLAAELRLETGVYQTTSNRFNIPNPGGSRFGLKEETAKFYGRLQGTFPVSENGSVRLLVAPLTAKYDYQNSLASSFDGVTFPANTPLAITYQFDSFRLGYIYQFYKLERFRAQVGGVGKIRRAKIAVEGGGLAKTYSNVGFVPLLNVGFRWKFWQPLELHFDLDGAAAKQGRAFDGALELFYPIQRVDSGISLGVRVLEGGADNEKVNTFALFHYAFAALTISL
jgi:hypothetical protein